MRPAVLVGDVFVPLFGVYMCVGPLVSRRTLRFGVRVPSEYAEAAVVRRERRGYRWRSAMIAVCAVAVLIALAGAGDGRLWWPSKVILVVEVIADVGCFWWAHRRITKVKSAEGWFAGRRQTVVADTSWRTAPQPFPVRWLLPAATVIVLTVIVGIIRYPHLPAYLNLSQGGHRVATSPFTAFGLVVGQLFVTGLWTGLLALVYRSRPDLDTADPAASLRGYRKALGAFARAALVLLACIDFSMLLAALQLWRVVRLSGAAELLVVAPTALGLAACLFVAVRAGAERARTTVRMAAVDRDDDRFWKAGIVYVNRDDPAVLVGARFAFAWTVNFGNPTAWLLVAGCLTLPTGLVVIRLVTGA